MSKAGDLYYGILNRISAKKERKFIKQVINDFVNDNNMAEIPEILNLKSYYKKGGISPFPYALEDKYSSLKAAIKFDSDKQLKYIVHSGKKLFFPRNFDNTKISRLYWGLIVEQDIKSPHCYNQNGFDITHEDVLIDVGCADAMYSLDQIEKVDRLILFETNEYWIEALKATFEPWKKKVEIVNAFVSDKTSSNHITLDDFFKESVDGKKIFLKMDVEGSEMSVLNGAKSLLTSNNHIRIAVASYHHQKDFEELSERLKQSNFTTKSTDGYILFYYDRNIKSPFLRRCIIQAENSSYS
jgi:hypothetical protein